jgi:pectate lyase
MLWLASPCLADIRDSLKRDDQWFTSDDGRRAMDNVLAWQVSSGGWPKNIDSARDPVDRTRDKGDLGSFDNNASVNEMRLLARACNATGDSRYRDAFLRGLDFIFKSQHPTGGWPQSWPLDGWYHDRITFNDGAMTNVLRLLMEVRDDATAYSFVTPAQRKQVAEAFDRGIDCILRCQIVVNGKLTAWCAQHDENTFAPVWGRSFEPPSISGGESGGILLLLMDLKNPTPRVIRAVEAGVHYFADNALHGFRFDRVTGGRSIIEDLSAPPLWARFYEIGTNRPIFANRKCEVFYGVHGTDHPAPNVFTYAFFIDWPKAALDRYPQWRAANGLASDPIVIKRMTADKAPATQPALARGPDLGRAQAEPNRSR